MSSIGRVNGGTTDAMTMPVTPEMATFVCSKSRVTKIPSSSPVRSRSAARRQLCVSFWSSNTPIVTLVLPTSMAISIVHRRHTAEAARGS
jgi:hypothetical protein